MKTGKLFSEAFFRQTLPLRLPVRCALAFVCLCALAAGAGRTHAQTATQTPTTSTPAAPTVSTASPSQTSSTSASTQVVLTPLQQQIETERARLASSNVEERRDAVQRLGAMTRPESARAASPALSDAVASVRAMAAHAVLGLPSEEAAALLLPLLRDKDEFVRRETAYALGTTGSRASTEALVLALAKDKSAGVRGAAAVALGEIADPSAVPVLAQTLGGRTGSAGLFSRITLRKKEENEFVRRAAAVALGQIGSREAVPALIAALGNERESDDVRREAARALGVIGDPSAVPALRAALTARDPYLSRLAYESLRRIDPASATRPT